MRAVRVVVAGRSTGPLLLNQAGKALTTLDARRMVNRIAKTAGCRHITPHGLRRTFCTAGLVSGVPMRDMQIAMRHADPRTTGLYGMAKNNKDRHASHRIASFLAVAGPAEPLQPGGCDQFRWSYQGCVRGLRG